MAVEFAILAPIVLLFLFSVLGAGLDGLFQLVLDDSVRDAARQIQIDGPASTGSAGFVSAVCNELGILTSGCATNLTYNVQTNASTANFADLTPATLSASGTLPNAFPSSFAAQNNILVQIAYPLPFKLPFIGSAITFTGTNSVMATTTARMEPYG